MTVTAPVGAERVDDPPAAYRPFAAAVPRGLAARIALLTAVAGFLLVCLQQAGGPYVIDEAEFPYIAEATARTGQPLYYHGELRPLDAGVFHPPLYVYALAGWIQLFGDSHYAVRLFGVACALATAALGAVIVARLVGRYREWAVVAFVAGYLLNPLVVASALVPDIDGTVGVLSLTAGLLVMTDMVLTRRPARHHVVLAGLVLGVALSTKLTTPLALVPLLGLALWWSGRTVGQAVRDLLAVVAIGVAVLLAWWAPLSAATGVDFAFPFAFTYDSLVGKSGDATLIERLAALRPVRGTLFWLDPLLLAVTAAGGAIAARTWRRPESRAVLLLAAFALVTTALYDVITTPVFRFPKYWIASVPAAVIVAVVVGVWAVRWVAQAPGGLGWRFPYAGALLGVALAGYLALAVLLLTRRLADTPSDQPLPSPAVVLAGLALCAVTLAVVVRGGGAQARQAGALAVCAALLLIAVNGLAQTLVHGSAEYSTRYYYGERGFEQAVADVRELTSPGQPVLAPKDIGYQAARPFYEDSLLFPDPAALQRHLSSGVTPVIVTRKDYDYSESVWPAAFDLLRRYATPVRDRPGSGFTVWRLRAAPTTTATGSRP